MADSPDRPEPAIEALHSTAQAFMQADTPEELADIAVEAIRDILDMPVNGVYYYDEAAEQLLPVAYTDDGRDLVGEPPVFAPGNSLAWEVFETGEPRFYADVATAPGRLNPDTVVRSEIILPVGEHGVLLIGSDEADAFDDTDVSLGRIVATHLATALDRIDREAELRRQNERLDEFVDIVSHDLLNPLNIAQGRLDLATGDADSEHVATAAKAVERSIELVDTLRTLARDGEQVRDPDTVSLAAAAEESWRHVPTADATLVVESDRPILADSTRLKQLFENLLSNAVTHGGTDVTVRVGALEDGFYVSDDGAGIHPDDRERAFDSGYSSTDEGMGFGLNIVREIADSHGWAVRVTDSSTGGARFEVTGVETATPSG